MYAFRTRALSLLVAGGIALISRAGWPVDADPSNYESIVPTLAAGDTLVLASGTYTGNLDIVGLQGSAALPITISGPEDKSAIFTGNACCNTVEISDSSFVVLKNVTVDGLGLAGVFGVSAKDGDANDVHDITIEGCVFTGHGASQQTVAISTKAPTHGWIIRHNLIDGAGTGMYLGNSDGTSPFVAGLIEGNLVRNTIGYNMQIKFQGPWPGGVSLPAGPTTTILRNNVFIKNDAASPDGDRPNVLVGGFPETGPGSDNVYEIYGNFFFHNPREAHLQASGRASIHDNVFVDAVDAAIVVTDHDLPLRRAHVYSNTIHGAARGIRFGNGASEGDFVAGNLIFAGEGISGPVQTMADNDVHTIAEAASVVNAPSFTLGAMDFYPLAGQAQGAAIDLSLVSTETDFDIDFNGDSKGERTFRGAYAGEGDNPGWQLDNDFKEGGAMGPGPGSGGGEPGTGGAGEGGAGASSSNGPGAGGNGTGGADGDGATDGGEDGCSCIVTGRAPGGRAWMLIAAVLAMRRRRPE